MFQFTCRIDSACSPFMPSSSSQDSDHRACPLPQYVVLSCSLSYLAVAVFLRLPIAIKAALLTLMAIVYILFIELSHKQIFDCFDENVQYVQAFCFVLGTIPKV
jgi:adenylate cyclase 1